MLQVDRELTGTVRTVVDESNTAVAAGSGTLMVLGTPYMIAMMEEATCIAAQPMLEDGETTVGTKITVDHTRASGIGTEVSATAVLTDIDRRRLVFSVNAVDGDGNTIGTGEIERFVVNGNRFMEKVGAK